MLSRPSDSSTLRSGVAGAYAGNLLTLRDTVARTADSIATRLGSGTSGILGRYSETGVLIPNFRYLREHPLAPIGTAFRSDLWLSDSGFLVTWMRGSLPLFLLVYLGLYFYMRGQLFDRKAMTYVFIVLMSFEVGFPNLTYFRTFYLLPFTIIYLNYLSDVAGDTPAIIPSDRGMSRLSRLRVTRPKHRDEFEAATRAINQRELLERSNGRRRS